jgi:hypothetical protein
LQAENGAAVKNQVELDITATAICLEIALALAINRILATLYNRQVGVYKSIADGAL